MGVPVPPWLPVPGERNLAGAEGQEAVGPKFWRGSATEAGVAVPKYIRPLVKVIISPNLLFCYAAAPAQWPGNVRFDPGRTLWGPK